VNEGCNYSRIEIKQNSTYIWGPSRWIRSWERECTPFGLFFDRRVIQIDICLQRLRWYPRSLLRDV